MNKNVHAVIQSVLKQSNQFSSLFITDLKVFVKPVFVFSVKKLKLVNFFDHARLAQEVCDLLDKPQERQRLGANARAFAQQNYDLQTVCLPRQLAWVNDLIGS